MSDLFEAPRLFITNAGSIARLELGGELDAATVSALRDHLDLLVESGTGDVELDMERVTFCDATALSALVGAHLQLASVDRRLRVIGASDRVVRLLQVTDLDMMLPEAVVASLPSGRTVETPRMRRDPASTGKGNESSHRPTVHLRAHG